MLIRKHLAFQYYRHAPSNLKQALEENNLTENEITITEITDYCFLMTYNSVCHSVYNFSKSVMNELQLLKVDKCNWELFDYLNVDLDKVYSMILPSGELVLVMFLENSIYARILHERKDLQLIIKRDGTVVHQILFFGQNEEDLISREKLIERSELIFRLLTFLFLGKLEEKILKPGESTGTRKKGKLKNELNIPIKQVNINWNITSIRTEGFAVRGHYAIRWTGENRTIPKLVFIPPFTKSGYIRKAKSQDENLRMAS